MRPRALGTILRVLAGWAPWAGSAPAQAPRSRSVRAPLWLIRMSFFPGACQPVHGVGSDP